MLLNLMLSEPSPVVMFVNGWGCGAPLSPAPMVTSSQGKRSFRHPLGFEESPAGTRAPRSDETFPARNSLRQGMHDLTAQEVPWQCEF
jgi:hypothetical protein